MFFKSKLTLALVSFTCVQNITAAPTPIGTMEIGTDGPADPETLGYTLSHLALIVNNITATRHFYGDILGMRHILTFQASEHYDITFMGYPQGGRNGTGFQTGEELLRDLKNSQGLIEFLHVNNRSGGDVPASAKMANTFSHVGMIVPDVREAQERMERFGVKLFKRLGENVKIKSPVVSAFGVETEMAKEAFAGLDPIGFGNFLLATDPDGNVVEMQQQYGPVKDERTLEREEL